MADPHKTGDIIAALDVGSARVACLVAKIGPDGAAQVVGAATRASAGVRGGLIVDWAAAASAIKQAVHAAENQAAAALGGYPLRDVVLSVPALHTRTATARGGVETGGGPVTGRERVRALASAQSAGLEALPEGECELIHTIPAGFALDGKGPIADPVGLEGRTLTVAAGLVAAQGGALRTLAGAVERAHLSVAGLVAGPYAAGLSSLVEDEMDLGATVVEMGAGTTSWAIFTGGALAHIDAVSMGGEHVTTDIAQGLTTPRAEAERIKILYGSAMAGAFDDGEMLEVPPLGEPGAEPRRAARSVLIGIIQPRLEEIFESVRARVKDAGLDAGRVVLTGGASAMPGVRELAQHVLDRPVRLGRPMRPEGLPEDAAGPGFAVAAGALHYLTRRAQTESPAALMDQAGAESPWARAWSWLRENW